jgi:hypothetical protein
MERGGEALMPSLPQALLSSPGLTEVLRRPVESAQYSRALIFQHPRSGILGHPLEPVIGRRAAPTRWRVVTAEIV